jgi:two-component system chemotaxis response regulator CheB
VGSIAEQKIVVVGASAGGVEALTELVAGLDPLWPASLLAVLHIPAFHKSELPAILSKAGPLPALAAQDDEPIKPSHIYVAPPDHHLVVDGGRMHLWHGPKENRHRPSINVLFRSAAEAFRERVIGIVLSGILDDGSAGLWWIKRRNGVALVQDPRDARFPDMPANALKTVNVDYTVPLAGMPSLLDSLVNGASTRVSPAAGGASLWKPKN